MTSETVSGFCDPRFAEVREEFERNFAERGELGAGVALYVDGTPVVDLWGGVVAPAGAPWERDTLTVVFSSTKGMAAAAMHVLIDRGVIDVEAPVARYWPEFAAHGKAGITVGMVMAHQAGLPVWTEPLPEGALLDWDLAAGALARQATLWEPGTAHGYHGLTLGFLEGEIVRRADGRSIGTVLREEIAGPLGADVWIGLPEAEEARVAEVILMDSFAPNSAMGRKLLAEPDWIGQRMLDNAGGFVTPARINSRAAHAAEVPAVGGVANARGLARLYAPLSLDGAIDGVRLVRPGALAGMRTTRAASAVDLMLRLPTTFTLGFSKTWGARALGPGEHVILGEHAFGTPGMGGSLGFADGEARLSFGYVMNRHGGGVGLNDRGQSLVDAAYRALGYRSCEPGAWVR